MDFNIRNFWILDIGGVEVWITETMVVTWGIMLLLTAFALFVKIKLNSFKDVPTGLQNVVELVIEKFEGFVRANAGERLMFLGNWYFMVFVFILVSNMSAMFGFRPPTADWSMTFAFALVTFVLIQVMGLRFQKGRYIKGLFEPFFIFFPMNVIGELARPISLSFRLFGNILAGMILMGVVYNIAPFFLRFVFPAALHGYFDFIIAILQTYIFCVLSLAFISNAAGLNNE